MAAPSARVLNARTIARARSDPCRGRHLCAGVSWLAIARARGHHWHSRMEVRRRPGSARTAARAAIGTARGARLVSICSGVFRPAETGLRDGKRVTAHWRHVDRFRARFPEVRLEPDFVYEDEGDILTSAGSAAGLDRCSYIVRRTTARRLRISSQQVIPPHREGGQAQFIDGLIRLPAAGGLAPVLEWVQANLRRALP